MRLPIVAAGLLCASVALADQPPPSACLRAAQLTTFVLELQERTIALFDTALKECKGGQKKPKPAGCAKLLAGGGSLQDAIKAFSADLELAKAACAKSVE